MCGKGFLRLPLGPTGTWMTTAHVQQSLAEAPSHSLQIEREKRENRSGGGGEIPFKESRKIIKGNKT